MTAAIERYTDHVVTASDQAVRIVEVAADHFIRRLRPVLRDAGRCQAPAAGICLIRAVSRRVSK